MKLELCCEEQVGLNNSMESRAGSWGEVRQCKQKSKEKKVITFLETGPTKGSKKRNLGQSKENLKS